jgi:hypothetical protein
VTGHLDINAVFKKKVTIKKYRYDEYTQRFKRIKGIPKDVRIGGFKLPLQYCTNRIIYGVPETKQQVCSFPNSWYVVYKIQRLRN